MPNTDTSPTYDERLEKLVKLHNRGLITNDEYTSDLFSLAYEVIHPDEFKPETK